MESLNFKLKLNNTNIDFGAPQFDLNKYQKIKAIKLPPNYAIAMAFPSLGIWNVLRKNEEDRVKEQHKITVQELLKECVLTPCNINLSKPISNGDRFEKWMRETVKSVYYSDNKRMNKAYAKIPEFN